MIGRSWETSSTIPKDSSLNESLAAMGSIQEYYGAGIFQRSGVCMLFREFLLQNDFQVQWGLIRVDQIVPGCLAVQILL